MDTQNHQKKTQEDKNSAHHGQSFKKIRILLGSNRQEACIIFFFLYEFLRAFMKLQMLLIRCLIFKPDVIY